MVAPTESAAYLQRSTDQPSSAAVARLVAVASLLIALTAALVLHLALPPTADEPHYLLIAHSIWFDRDVELSNNYSEQHYRRFYPGELDLHASSYGQPGKLYSGHNVGLAWALAPVYGLAGVTGAVLLMALLAAALSYLAYRLAADAGAPTAAAVAAWAVVTLSLPLVLYPSRIFPEVPAGLCITLSHHLLRQRHPTTPRLFAAMLLISWLPWLHAKFLAPAAILGLLALVRVGEPISKAVRWTAGDTRSNALQAVGQAMRGQVPRLLLLTMPIASVAAMGYYFWRWYGSPLPNAQYFGGGIELGALRYGLPGLLIDQEFGLLMYSPIYLLAVPGLVVALRGRQWEVIGPAAIGGVIYLVSALYPVWWGGYSFPPRFLVPVVVLLAPALAVTFAWLLRRPATPGRMLAWGGVLLLWLVTAFHSAVGLSQPRLVLNNGWRESQLLVALSPPGTDLPALFPSFIPDNRERETVAEDIPGQIGQLVSDDAPRSTVRQATPADGSGLLIDGLWAMRPRGAGEITVELRWWDEPGAPEPAEPIARLEYVARAKGREAVIAAREILPGELAGQEGYVLVALPYHNPGFALLGARPDLGVRLWYAGKGTLAVRRVVWSG